MRPTVAPGISLGPVGIEAGWDADLIAVNGDPIGHIAILTDPAKITHVWKAGELRKVPPQPEPVAG